MSKYTPFAWALGIVGVTWFLTYNNIENNRLKVEIAKAQMKSHELVVQDLNGNGTPEKFYEINGKKFFLEIDGKNLEDTLNSQ